MADDQSDEAQRIQSESREKVLDNLRWIKFYGGEASHRCAGSARHLDTVLGQSKGVSAWDRFSVVLDNLETMSYMLRLDRALLEGFALELPDDQWLMTTIARVQRLDDATGRLLKDIQYSPKGARRIEHQLGFGHGQIRRVDPEGE